MGNLLVSAVDSKGSLNKAVLEALEGFIKALASMPDAQQFSRYQTVLTWCWACQMHRHTAQASPKRWRISLQCMCGARLRNWSQVRL